MTDLRELVRGLGDCPGVYRMIDEGGTVLYVGKAVSLRKRVASYLRPAKSPRIASLMGAVRHIEVTVTHTETEALLLENNLIKTLRPRYNVLLRDDKSYPMIYLGGDGDFPRLGFHRGARRAPGRYFGPYPSAAAVRETLSLLQRVFPVRQCEDSVFRNRTRACLQYQIHRCSGPCVGLVDKDSYARDVVRTLWFLEGRNKTLLADLKSDMAQAAARLDFEQAARLRDRVALLGAIQERQFVDNDKGDADVVAVAEEDGALSVAVLAIRGGRQLGCKTLFPHVPKAVSAGEALAAFLPQYYLGQSPPARIYLGTPVSGRDGIAAALRADAGYAVTIGVPSRGIPRQWVALAQTNAADALRRRQAERTGHRARWTAMAAALGLGEAARVECFDISHTQGELPVASCVVFGPEGPIKGDYRRFHIADVGAGDDYAAIGQAVARRYAKAPLPDLVLIDGGAGQVARAHEALQALGHTARILGIAKGPDRRFGDEEFYEPGRAHPLTLDQAPAALMFLAAVRDEAHRFAITGHRARRTRARLVSELDTIPGVGPKRRQALVKALGGTRFVAQAELADLERLPGISKGLARRIYDIFHAQGESCP
ncbi:excinuclease ABC subunit UvrC [Acidiferrobacter sp.]|uniref:excinuclease ABC subunit UvrC n=1 Tax=Acidiferrobacter sp. TaxID=1872107 RepID=UPI00260FD91E|nr:excinuclease ABC subunit UvrC [Acidiferrobacter sp.]